MLGKLSYLSRVAMLPLAVREAIARESQGAPTGQIMALPRGGTMVYRLEYVLNGKHESVVLAPDGTVVTREEVEEDD